MKILEMNYIQNERIKFVNMMYQSKKTERDTYNTMKNKFQN